MSPREPSQPSFLEQDRLARAERELAHVVRLELARLARRAAVLRQRARSASSAAIARAFRRRLACTVADAEGLGLTVPSELASVVAAELDAWPRAETLMHCARALDARH